MFSGYTLMADSVIYGLHYPFFERPRLGIVFPWIRKPGFIVFLSADHLFLPRPKSKVSDWIRLGLILLVASASSMIAHLALIQIQTENVLLPSRRIANASYVLWTLANCCFPIFLSLAIKMLIIFLSFQVREGGD